MLSEEGGKKKEIARKAAIKREEEEYKTIKEDIPERYVEKKAPPQ